jgi:hypothetical protein
VPIGIHGDLNARMSHPFLNLLDLEAQASVFFPIDALGGIPVT